MLLNAQMNAVFVSSNSEDIRCIHTSIFLLMCFRWWGRTSICCV